MLDASVRVLPLQGVQERRFLLAPAVRLLVVVLLGMGVRNRELCHMAVMGWGAVWYHKSDSSLCG
jgi:hypothetical protein